MPSDFTLKNVYFLSLITTGYIIGEIAHFLIATTSKVSQILSMNFLIQSFDEYCILEFDT